MLIIDQWAQEVLARYRSINILCRPCTSFAQNMRKKKLRHLSNSNKGRIINFPPRFLLQYFPGNRTRQCVAGRSRHSVSCA